MTDGLGSLEELTRILLDAELAKLRALSEKTRLRQEEIARLSTALAARSEALGTDGSPADLAFRTGQDALWQDWVAGTKRRLSREAAETAARREAQLKKAQAAFGQVEALAGIRRLDDEERRMRAARRLLSDPGATGQSG